MPIKQQTKPQGSEHNTQKQNRLIYSNDTDTILELP